MSIKILSYTEENYEWYNCIPVDVNGTTPNGARTELVILSHAHEAEGGGGIHVRELAQRDAHSSVVLVQIYHLK